MDPIKNPFAPGAGAPPPALVGRGDILDDARIAIARSALRKPEKGRILVGLRGVGKTVLLQEMLHIGQQQNAYCIKIEAREEAQAFVVLLLRHLRQLLFDLRRQHWGEKGMRALQALASCINIIKLKYHDVELSVDVDPEPGLADSGDLEMDLPHLVELVALAAQEQNKALVLIVDELQYLSSKELGALIMTAHAAAQKQLAFLFMGAGLPQVLGLMGKAKSYAERLFDFSHLGALLEHDAIEAITTPLQNNQVEITSPALHEILHCTKAYPYFLQEWGYQVWKLAERSPVEPHTVQLSTQAALRRLDQSFFRVRFDRLTPREKKYLRALAELGTSARSGDIAQSLGLQQQSLGPVRNNLIKKGMVFSPAHGDTEFTVPLFDAFLKRILPFETS